MECDIKNSKIKFCDKISKNVICADIIKTLLVPLAIIFIGFITGLIVSMGWVVVNGINSMVGFPFEVALIATIFSELIFVILGYVYLKNKKTYTTFSIPKIKHLLLGVLIGLGIQGLLQIVAVSISLLFNVGLGANQTTAQIGNIPTVLMVLLAGVCVPIVEELTFRGFLYDWLSDSIMKIILPSIVFAIMHFEGLTLLGVLTVVVTFIIGFISALLRKHTGNIYSSISLHIAYNLATLFILVFIR